MGTLSNIVIVVLFACLVAAGFYLVDQKKRAEALAVFGLVFLALHVTLKGVASADHQRYDSKVVNEVAGTDSLGHTVPEPTWGHMNSDFFDFFALVGLVLIVAAVIVFAGYRASEKIQEAQLSSQTAQRQKELAQRGELVGQAANSGLPTYAGSEVDLNAVRDASRKTQ